MSEKQFHNFEAETKQILDLMVHSIYTHKEIFLRELISNASDAIDKAKFESITMADKYGSMDDLRIKITVDEANRILTISDNGIGMTKDECIQNIGSIARSGTKLFLEKMQNEKAGKDSGIDLIGKFGVGFYSAFMVSSKIVIETRSAHSENGVRWESNGDGTYSIEEIERPLEKRGTDITLTLKPEDGDDGNDANYADRYTLQRLIQKYSDYVHYPIFMDMPIPKKDDKEITQYEEKTINSIVSIWQKDKKEIKKEEYDEFYKAHFRDYENPFEVIHTKAEGTLEYTALLFIPSKQPFNFLQPNYERGLELYSRNVFIMEKCKELVPEYLRFVRGLVDSPDFSLNISREMLQHTGSLKKIASNIEKKVLDTLTSILKNDRKKYEEFWGEFGESIKVGIYSDYTKKDKLSELLLFRSSKSEGYTTLAEYKDRMKSEQEYIYYATGENKSSIERLPHMEGIRAKDYEVLYFTDRIDEFMASMLREFEGKQLRSILQGEIESKKDSENNDKEKKTDENVTEILNAIKNVLGSEKVSDVKESSRLKESAVCLVSKEDGISLNMAKVLAETGNNLFGMKAERILEINTNHKLFEVMKKEYEDNKESEKFREYSELLFDEASILEGNLPADPALFAKRLSELMIK